jgi:predicted DNA-binding ribbon-helix-helix protein
MKSRITMKSLSNKLSDVLNGRSTSGSVKEPLWRGLKEIAEARGVTLRQLVNTIGTNRVQGSNLSSAVLVHVVAHFKSRGGLLPNPCPALPDDPQCRRRAAEGQT